MLKELNLSNFRIFNSPVTIRFRPITILIGRNSSGKSSIVKFLLMLQQSTEQGNSLYLTPEGRRVNLGAFEELRNVLTHKNNLMFVLKVEADFDPDENPFAAHLPFLEKVNQRKLIYAVSADIPYGKPPQTGQATYIIMNKFFDDPYVEFSVPVLDDSTFLGDYMIPPSHTLVAENGTSVSKGQELEDFLEAWALHETRVELQDSIRSRLNSIRHLPPVRAEAQRVIIASHPPSEHVGSKGEYALPHLQTMITQRDDRYDFLLPYLQGITGIADVTFKTTGNVSQAIATNKTTGAEALIADYGFGVSQCVPILVQGAIMSPKTVLMVEQPEAQLHPTAQLELGSYFADLWTQRQVGSIIETHSDNILLRIRRLIARGDLNSRDVSVAFFTFDEQNGNMPIVKNLDIDEDGSMEAGLPMEFFGADILEGLQLGVGE